MLQDISEIYLGIYREKEKAELKDRKVLEILQLKDDKIDELQTMMASHMQQAANSQTLYVTLTEGVVL